MLNSRGPCDDSQQLFSSKNGSNGKKKRLPAGTPDPEAEVVSLSPKTLLESDRYVCEICNQGFQRDQNLQMHRRRHKLPWKLVKRDNPIPKKRVFVCPDPSCLHHDPSHALGDLVGIKKHYRRKHSNQKQWVCYKCSKGYAVQSDYKAHLKTCGSRGHSCDCGRVFSRVESFIEHQDVCNIRLRSLQPPPPPPQQHGPSPSPSPSTTRETNLGVPPSGSGHQPPEPIFFNSRNQLNLELQLLTTENGGVTQPKDDHQLHLSIGSLFPTGDPHCSPMESLKEHAEQQLRLAIADKAYAEEARWQAQRQVELAEQELSNARRIRQQATAELVRAQSLKEEATKQINSFMLQVTCNSCNQKFQRTSSPLPPETSAPHDIFRHSIAAMKQWQVKKGGSQR